jgi:hypothetical protein
MGRLPDGKRPIDERAAACLSFSLFFNNLMSMPGALRLPMGLLPL